MSGWREGGRKKVYNVGNQERIKYSGIIEYLVNNYFLNWF